LLGHHLSVLFLLQTSLNFFMPALLLPHILLSFPFERERRKNRLLVWLKGSILSIHHAFSSMQSAMTGFFAHWSIGRLFPTVLSLANFPLHIHHPFNAVRFAESGLSFLNPIGGMLHAPWGFTKFVHQCNHARLGVAVGNRVGHRQSESI